MARERTSLRRARQTIAVLGDGECEFWYFQMLKRNEPQIQFALKPEIPRKSNIDWQYERAVALSSEYDFVYWVIDLDVILAEDRVGKKGDHSPLKKFQKLIDRISKKYSNVKVLINNPCLEYWFLIHYEDTRTGFANCGAALKKLKKQLPAYEKNQRFFTQQGSDIYLRFKPLLPQAIFRSKQIGEWKEEYPHDPVAEIGYLVEKLLSPSSL